MSVQSQIDRIVANITAAFTTIGNKGGTVPTSQVSGNLADAIASIPAGVSIQRKSGSFTTNYSGAATVNCGFKPDFIAFDCGSLNNKNYCGVPFTESGATVLDAVHLPASIGTYVFSVSTCTQTSVGFSVKMTKYTGSLSTAAESNRTCEYVAIKYT